MPDNSKPTDTEMLDWLIEGGYCPAEWRPLEKGESPLMANRNGMVFIRNGSPETAMNPRLQKRLGE